MAQSLATLTAVELKRLKVGPTVAIWYREHEAAEPRVLAEAFPQAVACTFARRWAAMLAADNGRAQESETNSITIVGGKFDVVQNILGWMLSCCDGGRMRRFPSPPHKGFTHLYFARDYAFRIGCGHLENEAHRQMERIARVQIHSEDVRALYLLDPPDLEMQRYLADHVAWCLWRRTLRARSAYRTVREEIPALDAAINEVLAAKTGTMRGPRTRRATRQAKKARRHQATDSHGGGHGANSVKNGQETGKPKDQAGTLKAKLGRRSAKGGAASARVDLTAPGVSKAPLRGAGEESLLA